MENKEIKKVNIHILEAAIRKKWTFLSKEMTQSDLSIIRIVGS